MDAFVTCIYNGLHHTEYGGRNMRDARYRDSLINIANTGVKIFCYTGTSDYQNLKNQFARYSNIELVIRDITSFDFSQEVQIIKKEYKEKYSDLFWTQRCLEIMWGKFFMIQDVLTNHREYDNVYWIDAGLFHNDVIAPRYFLNNKPDLQNAGLPLFNPYFMEKLNAYVDGKVLLMQQINPHNKPIDVKYNKNEYKTLNGAVGGLFGGDASKMKVICDCFIEKMRMLLADKEICSEESILSAVYCDHPELFKSYVFQSWYHEGWGDRHNPSVNTFSDVFNAILEINNLEDNIVFCTLAAGQRFRHQSKLLIDTFLKLVDESIRLVVFTDDVSDYEDYGNRIILKHMAVPCVDCAFHYSVKYKVIRDTHRMFNSYNKIFYLDADCFFVGSLIKEDFKAAQNGLNVSLGNLSSTVVNPAIILKYNAITNLMSNISPTRQFRECAMLFKIDNKFTFNKFIAEWQLLYEFTLENRLAFSGEYIEITYACLKSDYPLADMAGAGMFINLRSHLHTILLNNPTQAIF